MNGLGASRLQVLPPEPLAILLEDYRIGDADAAVATLAAWPPEQVNTQSAELLATGIDTRKRAALVMLHTEAGLLRDDLGTVAGFGRFGGWERSQPLGHFDALYQQAVGGVEHLIAVSPTDPSLVAFLRDWHALVGSRLPLTAGYLAADRFPRDALSLLVSGIIRARMVTFEYPGRGRAYFINSAHPREITQLLNREWPSSFTKVSSGRIMSTGTVQQAEYLFRQALTLDPALVEAELRLGHLLQLADRPREAERAYRAVLERATGDDRGYSGYLATLFLGQVLQARQEWAPALEAYELAVQLRPDARSARMAIANLHVVTGRPDVAWQTAAALLTPPIDGTATDPLTLFHQGQTSRHDQLLAALRAYVRLP